MLQECPLKKNLAELSKTKSPYLDIQFETGDSVVKPRDLKINNHMYTDVPNLQCFDIPNGPIERLQALQDRWTAILTHSTVTLLGPDHESFMTFDSVNIISIGEYELKAKDE